MPLYEFLCPSCDRRHELLVRTSSEPIACPDCGSDKLEKCLSVPAAHTNGLGMATLPAGCGKPGCGPGGCGRM